MNHRDYRLAARSIFLLASWLSLATASLAAQVPTSLVGDWTVRSVAVDARAGMSSSHEADDPHLLGEVLVIHPDGQIDYPLATPCESMTWKARPRTTLAALVGANVKAGGGGGGPKTAPRLGDYGLKLGNPSVTPFVPLCTSKQAPGQTTAWDAADWFVSLTPDTTAMGNGIDTVLVLSRLTASTPIAPSFACKGTLSPTEATICKSQALAGRDRAVAQAYRRVTALAQKRKLNNLAAMEAEQRQWLKTRDACQTDDQCIIDRMRERITALMSP